MPMKARKYHIILPNDTGTLFAAMLYYVLDFLYNLLYTVHFIFVLNNYRFTDILLDVTSTKLNCVKFLQEVGIIASQQQCPGPVIKGKRYGHCNHDMIVKDVKDRKDSLAWRCRKVHKVTDGLKTYVIKDVKVTIRKGSWIQHSNLTLEDIIKMIYLWANDYTTTQICHELQMSQRTVIEWTQFLRESCVAKMLDGSQQIGGENVEVEIDESKFGKRKYYKGKRVEGQWVFGGREKENTSKVFMVPVHNRKRSTLIPLITKYIKKGSIIHSDCWKSYQCLGEMGYTHLTVNHSKTFKDEETGACTNKIESDWRHAKVSMPRYGVRQGKHASYLAEFMWRRKYANEDLFLCIIKDLNEHFTNKYFESTP